MEKVTGIVPYVTIIFGVVYLGSGIITSTIYYYPWLYCGWKIFKLVKCYTSVVPTDYREKIQKELLIPIGEYIINMGK